MAPCAPVSRHGWLAQRNPIHCPGANALRWLHAGVPAPGPLSCSMPNACRPRTGAVVTTAGDRSLAAPDMPTHAAPVCSARTSATYVVLIKTS